MQAPPLKKGTGASVDLFPQFDLDGSIKTIVVIKERFRVSRQNKVSRAGEAKARLKDEPWEEADSIKYPSDLCLRKPSTDVIVVGAAMKAYREKTRSLDVLVRVGPVEKFLRVHGLRVWYKGLSGLALSPGEPFEEVPLQWDLAFGGSDFEEGKKPIEEPRNPAGRGVVRDPAKLIHEPGPQIEDPHDPITSPKGKHVPAGAGAIGRHWEPRRKYVGTTDELWKKERLPLLPVDFDDRFNQVAPPYLITPQYLRGGELVQVHNMSAEGPMQFDLPRLHFFVGARTLGGMTEHRSVLDTVMIEPNDRIVELTWRALVPMPRRMSDVTAIQVHEKKVV